MAKFILRNRETDELIPVTLTPEQERLLAFFEEYNLDLSGYEATEVPGEFREV
jgi:hypothetical protein